MITKDTVEAFHPRIIDGPNDKPGKPTPVYPSPNTWAIRVELAQHNIGNVTRNFNHTLAITAAWTTDPDGRSGYLSSSSGRLAQCKKWYSSTTSTQSISIFEPIIYCHKGQKSQAYRRLAPKIYFIVEKKKLHNGKSWALWYVCKQ